MAKLSHLVGALALAVLLAPGASAEEVFDPVSVLGPAPWMPTVGGSRASVQCDHPDVVYHPRCREWREAYEAWREKARKLMEEHARETAQ